MVYPYERRRWNSWFPRISLAALLATLAAVSTTINTSVAVVIDTETIGSNTMVTDTLDAPTASAATNGMNTTISWTATSDTYAGGHRVYRATTSGGPYTEVAEIAGLGTTSYLDSPASNTYYYTVRAFSDGWESADSAEATAHVGEVELLGSWQTGTTHTATAGPLRTLVVVASNEEASDTVNPLVTSMSYGGQAMTQAISDSVLATGRYASLHVWTLDEAGIAAASGSTITATWTSTPGSPLYAHATFGRTNQGTPVVSTATGTATTHTPNPVTLGSFAPNNGDMVIVAATSGFTGAYFATGGFTLGSTEETATNTTALGAAYLSSNGSSVSPTLTFDDTTIWRQIAARFALQTP